MIFFRYKLFLTILVCLTKADQSDHPKNVDKAGSTPVRSNKIPTIEEEAAGDQEICTTPGCLSTASSIQKSMNTSFSPCDNFYKFTCDNFMRNIAIPNDVYRFSNFDKIRDKVKLAIKKNIENIDENDPKIFKQMHSFYSMCLNREKIAETRYENILEILKEIGDWPLLQGDSWEESKFHWRQTELKSLKLGYKIDYFFNFQIFKDRSDKNRTILVIRKNDIFYTLKNKSDKFKFMVDFAKTNLGASSTQALIDIKEYLKFNSEIYNIKTLKGEINITYLKNLQTNYPNIPWVILVKEVFDFHPSLKDLNNFRILVNFDLESFYKLISKTSNRVISNYMMWNIVWGISSYDYTPEANNPTWKYCIDLIRAKLPSALGALYVRRNFDEESKKAVNLMIKNLKNSLQKLLLNAEWMDESTKKAAIEKSEYILALGSYPNEFLNNKILDDYHQKIVINFKNYLKTVLNIDAFFKIHNMELELQLPNRSHWIHHQISTDSQAHYKPLLNNIEISRAILQEIFFSTDRPNYLNYGAIGQVVGHEIGHAFDDQRKIYDKEGNIKNWWQEKSAQEFKKRTQSLINIFNNYTEQDYNLRINGTLTLSENIADNIGIRMAYYAYNAWEKENKVEPPLPGFQNYTTHQMFWISAASVWCAKFNKKFIPDWIKTKEHTIHEYRVIGMLSNMHEFSKDFNCSSNSMMNNSEKLSILR